jgi:enoyl-CoA hydratase/carnithine racemase
VLKYRVEGPVAWIGLNRPEKRNALERGFYAELCACLERAEGDSVVRAVILYGEGPCFSAGGDIASFGEIGGVGDRRAYMREAMSAFKAVESCSKPVIAAVHGYALGGGCELTIVSDVVIADETARFGMPEASVGLVPGPGVARGLAQVNLHWMKLMVLGGEVLDAEEARLAGLVNRIVPAGQHLDAAAELAGRMASKAPVAQATGKRLLNSVAPEAYDYAAEMIALLQSTEDFAEGIAAFKAKRPPEFRGL